MAAERRDYDPTNGGIFKFDDYIKHHLHIELSYKKLQQVVENYLGEGWDELWDEEYSVDELCCRISDYVFDVWEDIHTYVIVNDLPEDDGNHIIKMVTLNENYVTEAANRVIDVFLNNPQVWIKEYYFFNLVDDDEDDYYEEDEEM